jgi:ubiquinol-cytochrome c reductase cytochrome b subunit
MAGGTFEKYKSDGSIGGNVLEWVDARFPATSMWKGHLSEYYCPKNFNFWYFFGSLALLVLVIQIVTGIFLVMHYKPDAALNASGVPIAFASVEYIMRDVPGGWLIRYMHSTGASAFFIVVYHAHVPWPALRFVSQAARADLAVRCWYLFGADG